ncbi:MAG TPA: ankyrin repeat domain-containing protein [Leucothrix mucor]|nr:ankyrin repeat domain-containing protein [Leucothrix mucor]
MNTKNKLRMTTLGLSLPLLMLIAGQTVNAKASALDLSQSEMLNIINGKIAKVQAARKYVPKPKPVYHRPTAPAKRVVARKPAQYRPPVKRYVQPQRRQQPQRYVAPVRRQAPPANLPAWRRPASHTETRGSGDAIFAAAKNRNMRMLQQILESGVNVNHRNFNGETALHIAASLGNLQMVRYLISKGASVNGATGKRWLPIHHAVRFAHPAAAHYLIARGASLWAKNSDGLSALDIAKKSKNPQIRAIAQKRGY